MLAYMLHLLVAASGKRPVRDIRERLAVRGASGPKWAAAFISELSYKEERKLMATHREVAALAQGF